MSIQYREANQSHISAMARIRAADWETEKYWNTRISGYLDCELNPQQALKPRIIYIALESETVLGFIAGHLTRRYACDGELEWIDVVPAYRRNGVATELLRLLAAWFVEQKSLRICADVDPANTIARHFYMRHGARDLNKHWLVWENIQGILK